MYQTPEHLLIDGYNLIRSTPRFATQETVSLEAGRTALIRALGEYAHDTGAQITLFFDGDGSVNRPTNSTPIPTVTMIFSSPPQIADDLIKEAVQAKHGAKRLRVITSDREILNFAKNHKIRTTTSHVFADEMEEPPRQNIRSKRGKQHEKSKNPTLSEAEVNAWEKLFSQPQDEQEPGQKVIKATPAQTEPTPPPPEKAADLSVTPNSVDAWEHLFNAAEKEKQQDSSTAPQDEIGHKCPSNKRPLRQPPAVTDRSSPHLSKSDIDAWEAFFNNKDDPPDTAG